MLSDVKYECDRHDDNAELSISLQTLKDFIDVYTLCLTKVFMDNERLDCIIRILFDTKKLSVILRKPLISRLK